MSHCLQISTCGVKGTEALYFHEPFFNGIRIIDPATLLWGFYPPYYGDEVVIGFYRYLGLQIGDLTDPTWDMQEGYKYIYNMTTRVFKVYDETNTEIYSKDNIKSMGDMGITFEIYKSHQFIIIKDTLDTKYPFLLPVKLIFDHWPGDITEDMDIGILNYYPIDKKRPYSIDDIFNPTVDMHYIDGYVYNEYFTWSWTEETVFDSGEDKSLYEPQALTKPDIDFKRYGYDPLVICDDFEFIDRSITKRFKGSKKPFDPKDNTTWPPGTWPPNFDPDDPKTWPPGFDIDKPETWPPGFDPDDPETWPPPTFDPDDPKTWPDPYDPDNPFNPDDPTQRPYEWFGTMLDISWLLPCYTISLYPELMPIRRSDETINNRAVYEPWMIWGLRLVTNRRKTDVPELHELIVFDLSPSWC